MRQILFKAKRVDNGEWVEGDLVHSVYKINDFCVGKYGSEIGMHQIDPETICQYTGLTDKNGNKIWENDVVNVLYSSVSGEERYANGYIINDLRTTSIIGWLDYANEIEVIGNIFDNADLLKGE